MLLFHMLNLERKKKKKGLVHATRSDGLANKLVFPNLPVNLDGHSVTLTASGSLQKTARYTVSWFAIIILSALT